MFSKLNTGHFAQVSLLLTSAAYMCQAINDSGKDRYKLIGNNNERVLVQAFREPYVNSLSAICTGIKKQLDMQHDAIIEQLANSSFDAEQVAKYLSDYDACKVYFDEWDSSMERIGTAFISVTSIVTSPFLALEQTYHDRLRDNSKIGGVI